MAVLTILEVDIIRLRTIEGMARARQRGKLKGKQPELSAREQAELCRMHATDECTIADLAGVFSVSRATVYRVLQRAEKAKST